MTNDTGGRVGRFASQFITGWLLASIIDDLRYDFWGAIGRIGWVYVLLAGLYTAFWFSSGDQSPLTLVLFSGPAMLFVLGWLLLRPRAQRVDAPEEAE